MPVQAKCTKCGKLASLPDSAVGKTARCPCGNSFAVQPPTGSDQAATPAKPASGQATKIEMACPKCGVVVRGLPEVFVQPITCPDCKATGLFKPATPAEQPFWKKPVFLAGAVAGGVGALGMVVVLYALFAKRPQQSGEDRTVSQSQTAESHSQETKTVATGKSGNERGIGVQQEDASKTPTTGGKGVRVTDLRPGWGMPTDMGERIGRATALVKRGDWEELLQTWQRAMRDGPDTHFDATNRQLIFVGKWNRVHPGGTFSRESFVKYAARMASLSKERVKTWEAALTKIGVSYGEDDVAFTLVGIDRLFPRDKYDAGVAKVLLARLGQVSARDAHLLSEKHPNFNHGQGVEEGDAVDAALAISTVDAWFPREEFSQGTFSTSLAALKPVEGPAAKQEAVAKSVNKPARSMEEKAPPIPLEPYNPAVHQGKEQAQPELRGVSGDWVVDFKKMMSTYMQQGVAKFDAAMKVASYMGMQIAFTSDTVRMSEGHLHDCTATFRMISFASEEELLEALGKYHGRPKDVLRSMIQPKLRSGEMILAIAEITAVNNNGKGLDIFKVGQRCVFYVPGPNAKDQEEMGFTFHWFGGEIAPLALVKANSARGKAIIQELEKNKKQEPRADAPSADRFVGEWKDEEGFVSLNLKEGGKGFLFLFSRGGGAGPVNAGGIIWKATGNEVTFSGSVGKGTASAEGENSLTATIDGKRRVLRRRQ